MDELSSKATHYREFAVPDPRLVDLNLSIRPYEAKAAVKTIDHLDAFK